MSSDIVEGVFAIHKPPSITSASVIRDVQSHFRDSQLFRPWLKQEQQRLREARAHHKKKRFRNDKLSKEVKIGHGGTLDPMATGVLILGVGIGTKRLPEFLSCTKSYDTVVLFGQSTDTYDVTGKTVARKDYSHITREQVEAALPKFRGSYMQVPPIYSALRIDGKRLYEYAREGKAPPKEIKERPVTVTELEMVEWYPGGTHKYHWPTEDAEPLEREAAEKLSNEVKPSMKRDRESSEDNDVDEAAKKAKLTGIGAAADDIDADLADGQLQPPAEGSAEQPPCPAPACRLKMTVTSGFYVRSLCHDLGAAVGSLASMASLVRTRQADFVLGKNVFEYADLKKGEETWGPEIKRLLQDSTQSEQE